MNECWANRLQKGRNVLGTNRLGGESLLGRIVYEGGESSMDEMYWGKSCGGGRGGGEFSTNVAIIMLRRVVYGVNRLQRERFA